MNKGLTEPDYEFKVSTTDFSDRVGKTRFTAELTFFKCLSGSALISINSKEHTLAARHSFVLPEYKIFQVIEVSADFLVKTISIPLSFYYETVAGFDGTIFNALSYSAPELYTITDLYAADIIFESLRILYEKPEHTNRRAMAMNLIACYIYEMCELTLPHIKVKPDKAKNSTFTDTITSFYNLVSEYGNQNRNIDFYAEKLNMSGRYLYKIVHDACHITPKQLIDDVVISLIKQLLLTTSLDCQQISDRFNFPDQSAFGQYFKRCTGHSTTTFRNINK